MKVKKGKILSYIKSLDSLSFPTPLVSGFSSLIDESDLKLVSLRIVPSSSGSKLVFSYRSDNY